jgi:uncharacterized protein DUF6623
MGLETYFAHGVSFVAETVGGANISSPGPLTNVGGVPWSDVVGLPQGFGRSYRGKWGNNVWFHVAVPTPTLRNSARVRVQDVFVQYSTDAGVALAAVHVWDGPDRVAMFDLNGQGDHLRTTVPGVNSFAPREPGNALHAMNFGLVISCFVRFTSEGNVMFASGGATFIVVD